MELKYCPNCGKPKLEWDHVKKWNCSLCDYTYYHNCAAAVAVLLFLENELLFTVRNQEPKIRKLDLPGGFIDPNETAEMACVRELKEELNLDLNKNSLMYLGSQANDYLYKKINYQTLDLFFGYKLNEKPNLKLELSEVSRVEWLNIGKINFENLAFDSQIMFLKDFDVRDFNK